MNVSIRPLRPRDAEGFVSAVRRSRKLHRPWVYPPESLEEFRAYLSRARRKDHHAIAIVEEVSRSLAGAAQLTHVVLGPLCSAYLGYYAFEPHAGTGCMTEGVGLVLDHAFGRLGLHRVEANIQPGNETSIALAKRLGFRKEGFSPKYLRIAGRWRDHERWAILAEEWR